jgi:beta-mannosidase
MSAPAAASQSQVLVTVPLAAGWEMASAEDPALLMKPDSLPFIPAKVPGTAASALRAHKGWRMGDGIRFDEANHLFRCRFDAEPANAGEEIFLRVGGVATLAEVCLNGETILKSKSMFASHEVNVSRLIRDRNELTIVCHSLAAALRERRGRQPAARWRTRVVSQQQLRWFRTTLLGRAPGFSPEPEPVGPWRPVTLVRRRRLVLEGSSRQVDFDGSAGIVDLRLQFRLLDTRARPVSGSVLAGGVAGRIEWNEAGDQYHGQAVVRVPDVVPWSPHTHGEAALYPLRIQLELADGETAGFELLPAGFRRIDTDGASAGEEGLALCLNGTQVFCRGVVWTPPDVVALDVSPHVLSERLQLLRDAGFNLIRLAGTTIYESETFHRLCDELGLLVWQDMMFANMDYPFADREFRATVRAEAEAELSRLSRHPSSSVICGNSEIEQQAAMLGLDPALGRCPFFDEELPRIAAGCCPGVPYIRSSPSGGDLPFRTRSGVAHYFGVGAYRRPIEDVRRAGIRFASECLAFANVADPEIPDAQDGADDSDRESATKGSRADEGVRPTRGPRDSGADWDFSDVRDHYLGQLYAVEPSVLRRADPGGYWELSRIVSGEVMAEVFGEWRRPASVCRGGIVLWSADLEPGDGWGILDYRGWPKAAYWFLRRALAPCTVWTTDEGLNGVDIHVANDRPEPNSAWMRVALYRLGEHKVAEADRAVDLPKHTAWTFGVEEVLGRFIDAACAYRFGPPGHDLIVASLHRRRGDVPFAQAFRFPGGRPVQRVPIRQLGITAESRVLDDGAVEILLGSQRLAWGTRVGARGFRPDDAWFGIEPGGQHRVLLTPIGDSERSDEAVVTAVNAEGQLPITLGRST